MKICTICKKEKDLSEFYQIWYKKCQKHYPHTRCKSCEKKLHRKYYIKNRKNILLKIEKYREENPEKVSESRKINYSKNRHKWKARSILCWYIRSGKIRRPKVCEKCMKERKIEAHHVDYDKPLYVEWLCFSCHRKTHKMLRG